jgi:hypothetical protein
LPTDKLAYCDHQFVDALIGLLVHLAHTPIRFFKLFGNLIEAFAGRRRQFGDHSLQTVYALSDGFSRHGGIVSRSRSPMAIRKELRKE